MHAAAMLPTCHALRGTCAHLFGPTMRPSCLGESEPTDPAALLSDRRVRPWNDEFTAPTVSQRVVVFLLFLCHLSLRVSFVAYLEILHSNPPKVMISRC